MNAEELNSAAQAFLLKWIGKENVEDWCELQKLSKTVNTPHFIAWLIQAGKHFLQPTEKIETTEPYFMDCKRANKVIKVPRDFPSREKAADAMSVTTQKDCDETVVIVVRTDEQNEPTEPVQEVTVSDLGATENFEDTEVEYVVIPENADDKNISAIPVDSLHDSKRRFICEVCGNGFNRPYDLEIHGRVHSKERPFRCFQCGQTYTQQSSLNTHLKEKGHSNENINVDPAFISKEQRKSILMQNEIIYGIENGEHECDECKKKFSTKLLLHHHKKLHVPPELRPPTKVYMCGVCQRGFSKMSNLTTHYRVHTRERPFLCTKCNDAFTQSSSLNVHMQRSHGDCSESYQCAMCSATYAIALDLRKHFKRCHTVQQQSEGPVDDQSTSLTGAVGAVEVVSVAQAVHEQLLKEENIEHEKGCEDESGVPKIIKRASKRRRIANSKYQDAE